MKKLKFISIIIMVFAYLASTVPWPAAAAAVPAAAAANAATAAGPATYNDISGHWAKAAIERWSKMGVLIGNEGLFKPDDIITRAELAAIINRIIKFPATEVSFFPDIKGKWYEADINALARQNVYLVRSGMAMGDAPLTREEAVWMLYKSFTAGKEPSLYNNQIPFNDEEDVSREYAKAVSIFRQYGFISGFEDFTFRPKDSFTRAQVVTILNKIIEIYIDEPGEYFMPPASKICIAVPGVTLTYNYASYIILLPAATEGLTILERSPAFGVYWGSGRGFDREHLIFNPPPNNPGGGNNEINYLRLIYDSDDATIDKDFAGGTGRQNDPYLIENEAQLKLLDKYLSEEYKDHYFDIISDIDLSSEWKPIGAIAGSYNSVTRTYTNKGAFCGILNGNGYTINNLYINYDDRKDSGGSKDNEEINLLFGLFAYLNGTVKNLNVNGEIAATSSIQAIGGASVVASAGAIAGIVGNRGSLNAVIEYCNVDVDINVDGMSRVYAGGIAGAIGVDGHVNSVTSSGSVRAHSGGTIESDYACAGGIAGYIGYENRTVWMYYGFSNVAVSASGGYQCYAGGIVGAAGNNCMIDGFFSAGEVKAMGSLWQNNAGGIVGILEGNFATIKNCGSMSDVSASGTPNFFNSVGGVAGTAYFKSRISHSFGAGTITVGDDSVVGGIVGRAECRIYTCYTTTIIDAPLARNNYKENGLYGWERNYLEIIMCGVFNVSAPFFMHHEDGSDEFEINYVRKRSLEEWDTYELLGGGKWQKDQWVFDPSIPHPYAIPYHIDIEMKNNKW